MKNTSATSGPTKTVLITGAGSGLGLRLAELYGERGNAVIALDLRLSSAVRTRLQAATSGRVHVEEVDVRNGADVVAATDRGVATFGGLNLVVNCAGVQQAAVFDELPEEAFRRIVDINLVGSRNVAAATLRHLGVGGHLVLIASMAGLVPNYSYAAYCASKYGVVGLAEVLRLERHPDRVDVSVVCPPEVDTPMVAEERETMLAPTRALKEMAGTLELESAVRQIITGIDERTFMIIPGRRARFTALLTKILPKRVLHLVSDRVVTRELAI
ncbi:SDR family NAD(P)-dependent oxidoreductase [Rhodococcus artemisiae]|uniref:SDR family NAD(P)-dependent oxidoreductase n=1 Tax=Rhodococcus artemisiae TaxID=714159 RepID=A0ABU7LAH2_9NOCA|nr:SDR family NAD(P)-dependent oxidoreductase [Rhodococcus artemisiae]MEE2058525.1 SDR family NAD(P)-dependent oxidoreductase [Rhodococcus artemisiae]